MNRDYNPFRLDSKQSLANSQIVIPSSKCYQFVGNSVMNRKLNFCDLSGYAKLFICRF